MIDIAGCVGGHSDHPVEGENRNHKPDDKQACVNDFPGPGFLVCSYVTPPFTYRSRTTRQLIIEKKQDDEEHDPTDGGTKTVMV